MPSLDDVLRDGATQYQNDLFEWLRIGSVSADPRHAGDIRLAAEWIDNQLRRIGLESKICPTAGNPIVFAQSPPVANAPTVLVYGHYDVQPPDPLDQWVSGPFEPTVRDGKVFARGATDDKGQLLTHVKGVQAHLQSSSKLPLQVKFLIEGEEEVGSANLEKFIEAQRQLLKCNCVVISDSSQFGPERPAITYGLRGIAYYELRLQGPKQDLHSGTFGGGVTNPANALCAMLAALVDADGRIQLPGFYDDVVPLAPQEREQFAGLGFDDQAFMRQIGVAGLAGEKGFSTLERRWARPTCDVNGLWSGYQGEGAKTILPARAGAKLSFRLVPRQDPKKVTAALSSFFRSRIPAGIEMELIDLHGAPGVLVPLESPYMAAAARAIERSFGRAPVFIREGGSIPVVAAFAEMLGVDTLLLGWGLDDDNAHSPNEKFSLADFQRGIRASAYLWEELAQRHPSG